MSGVTKEHSQAFAEAVQKAMADFEAMTSGERAIHYEQQADEIHGKIERLNDRNRCIEGSLRDMEKSLRETAKYYREGGKTMKEWLTEEGYYS